MEKRAVESNLVATTSRLYRRGQCWELLLFVLGTRGQATLPFVVHFVK